MNVPLGLGSLALERWRAEHVHVHDTDDAIHQ